MITSFIIRDNGRFDEASSDGAQLAAGWEIDIQSDSFCHRGAIIERPPCLKCFNRMRP